MYAGTSYFMSSGKPGIVICNGIEEAVRASAGALTSWGDKIPLFILCAVKDTESNIIKATFSAVARKIFVCSNMNDVQLIPEYLNEFPVTVIFSKEIPAEIIVAKLNECKIENDKSNNVEITEVIRQINMSQKTVLLAGRGCISSIDKALELAERIKAPLLLTAGATTMPVDRIKFLSNKEGPIIPSGNPVWLNAFISADLILALGTAFSEVDWFGLRDVRIYRGKILGISDKIVSYGLADLSLTINLRDFFAEISKIEERKSRRFYDSIMKKSKKYREILKEEMERLKGVNPLHPSLVAYEILKRSSSETIFVSEGGACGMWLWMHLWLKPFVFPVQNGTIGVSIPMALGVKSSYPDRDVWAVMGDGAFFYHINEMHSLVENKLPAVFFVFNDSSWGAIRLAQRFVYRENYIGTDITDIDYAKIAEIYGCEGITVRKYEELVSAIEIAKGIKKPLIVDIKIQRDCMPVAGGNFVIAEFDGVLKYLTPGLVTSSIKNMFHGKIPKDVFRIIRKSIL